MKIKAILSCALILSTTAVNAQKASPENYLRSSLYTILITSPTQDGELVEESQKAGEGAALIKAFSGDNSSDPNEIVKAPQLAFDAIPIPDQFNDHNLYFRLINFDSFFNDMTETDKADAEAMSGKKKGGFGKALLGAAKDATGVSNYPTGGNIDSYGPWVLAQVFKQNNIADSIIGKWYGYNSEGESRWDQDFTLISERGYAGSSEAEKEESGKAGLLATQMQQRGMDLVPNTYVLAVNFRYRSNQAIVAEAEAAAKAVGGAFGGIGKLAASAASIAGSAAAGEGFTVQAHTYLFRLKWNDELNNRFAEEIWAQNKTLEDLIATGMCELEYVGHEKSSSRVRQSLTNNKTSQADLIQIATERAIDGAIANLQEKFEAFRTAFPVYKDNGDGTLCARVGMKEGISKGDEYEILEASIDPKTNTTVYKSVGKVKAVDKQIWDNRAGVETEVADGEENAAAQLGYTTFSGAKKGQNFDGYYLRLKKKK